MATYESNIPRVDKFLNGTWIWFDDDKKDYRLTFKELAKLVNLNRINNDTYLLNSRYGTKAWYRLKHIDGLKDAVNEYLNSPRQETRHRWGGRTAGDRDQRQVADASTQGRTLGPERARSAESGHQQRRGERQNRARSYSASSESSQSERQRTRTRSKFHDYSKTSQSTANEYRKTSHSNNRARSPPSSKTRSVSRNVERESQWKMHWRATQSSSKLQTRERVSNVEYHTSNREPSMAKRGTQTQTLSTKTSVGSGTGTGINTPGSPRKGGTRPSFGPSIDERKRFEEPGRVHPRNDQPHNRRDESSSDWDTKTQEGNPRQRGEDRYSMSNASRVLNKPMAMRLRNRRPSDTSTIVSNVSITSTKRISRLKQHPDIQERRKVMKHRERLNEQKRELQRRKAQVGLKRQQLEKLQSEYNERVWGQKYIQATEKKDLLLEQAELKAFRTRLAEEVTNPSIFARSPVVAVKNAAGVLEKQEKLLSDSIKDREQLHQDCVKIAQKLAKVCGAVKHIYSSEADKNCERDRHDPILGSLMLLEKEKSKIKQDLQNFPSELQSGEATEEIPKEPSFRGPKRQHLPAPVPEVLNSSLHLNNMPSYDTGFTSDFDYQKLCLDDNTSDASEGDALGKKRRYVVNLQSLSDGSPSPRDVQERRKYMNDQQRPRSRPKATRYHREKPRERPKSKPADEGREPGFSVQRSKTTRVHRPQTEITTRRCKTDRTKRIYRRKVEERWVEYGEEQHEDRQYRTRAQKYKANPLFTFLASDRERERHVAPKKVKKYSWSLDYFAVNERTPSPSPPPDDRRLSPERAKRGARRGRDENIERTPKSPNRVYRKRTTETPKSKQPYSRRARSPPTSGRGRNMHTSPGRSKKKSSSPAKKMKRKTLEKRQRNGW